jgi:hypothetical protein
MFKFQFKHVIITLQNLTLNLTLNKITKPQTNQARVKEGLQGGITHSFISHGEPITLSSLHMGLIPHVVMSFFKEGHVPSST